MSGVTPRQGGEGQVVSTPSGNGLFSAPAVLRNATGTWLFAADGGGTAAWRLGKGQPAAGWGDHNPRADPALRPPLLLVSQPGGRPRVDRSHTGGPLPARGCRGRGSDKPIRTGRQ